MSTRRGTWVINRLGPNGWPTDMVYSSELVSMAQKYTPSLLNWFLERDMNQKFDHEMYGLKPKHRATGTKFIFVYYVSKIHLYSTTSLCK